VGGIETALAAERAGHGCSIEAATQVLVVHAELRQRAGRRSPTLTGKTQQDVFGPDVGAVQAFRLLPGEFQHLLQARCDRQGSWRPLFSSTKGCLNRAAEVLEIGPNRSEEPGGETVLSSEQAQQKMFRADAGMVVEQGIFEPLLLDNPLICHRLAVFAPARFSAAASQKLGWAAADGQEQFVANRG